VKVLVKDPLLSFNQNLLKNLLKQVQRILVGLQDECEKELQLQTFQQCSRQTSIGREEVQATIALEFYQEQQSRSTSVQTKFCLQVQGKRVEAFGRRKNQTVCMMVRLTDRP
jgi:hypothetical protein